MIQNYVLYGIYDRGAIDDTDEGNCLLMIQLQGMCACDCEIISYIIWISSAAKKLTLIMLFSTQSIQIKSLKASGDCTP